MHNIKHVICGFFIAMLIGGVASFVCVISPRIISSVSNLSCSFWCPLDFHLLVLFWVDFKSCWRLPSSFYFMSFWLRLFVYHCSDLLWTCGLIFVTDYSNNVGFSKQLVGQLNIVEGTSSSILLLLKRCLCFFLYDFIWFLWMLRWYFPRKLIYFIN